MNYLARPLKLAVFFDQELKAGGGYQQSINVLKIIDSLPKELVTPVWFVTERSSLESVRSETSCVVRYLHLSLFRKLQLSLRRKISHPSFLRLWSKIFGDNYIEKAFSADAIDLAFFLSPSRYANDLEKTNYIFTVWDVCHRDQLEFPEVRSYRVFESREEKFRSVLPKSTAILVDSVLSKTNLINRYGIDEGRIYVFPFQASQQVMRESVVPGSDRRVESYANYVFYPAQFWAHKNHVYVLRALQILEGKYGVVVNAVFAGSEKGNLDYVKKLSKSVSIEGTIHFLDFVPEEDMAALYRNAIALVMPTYFGPTNIPPLEAFSVGTPVLYPDLPGLREQVGDAALLVDLDDPGSLAGCINSLISDKDLREELIRKGTERLKLLSPENESLLIDILEEFQQKRICWK